MKRYQWWLLALAFLAWIDAGIVWEVQFSGYPLWRYVGHEAFPAYFGFWQRCMTYVAGVPFVVTVAGSPFLPDCGAAGSPARAALARGHTSTGGRIPVVVDRDSG